MPRNGIGAFRRLYRPAVPGPGSRDQFNGELQDVADELNNSLGTATSKPMRGRLRLNGQKLILDADADSSFTADTDDQVDLELGGADRLTLTAAKAASLDSYASASGSADKAIYATGSLEYAATAITATGRAILSQSSAAGVVSLLEANVTEDLIETKDASSSASITFDLSGYSEYVIRVRNAIPSSASGIVRLRTSTDAGSSYDAGASDYGWRSIFHDASLTAFSTGDTSIKIGAPSFINVSASSSEAGMNMEIHIINPGASQYTDVYWMCAFSGESTAVSTAIGSGRRLDATAVDAVQILIDSANIESGKFSLYGIHT